jgi:hypothetical protein
VNGPTKISTTDTIITVPPTQLVASSNPTHPGTRAATRPDWDIYRPSPCMRAGSLEPSALSCERTTRTGQIAWRITPSEMLPSRALRIPRWSRQPITISPAPISLAEAMISSSTSPILRWVLATGPPARQNALRHGLLSAEMLVPGEDEAALRELSENLRDELRPVGELEGLLVKRVMAAAWGLRRLGRVEAGIFAWERLKELAERAEREARDYEQSFEDNYMKYASIEISDGEKHSEALSRAQQMRSEQEAETATLGRTLARDANSVNAFSKLSRYETTIERGLYKALHELQRLQAARGAGSGTPPPWPLTSTSPESPGRAFRGGIYKWVRFAKMKARRTDRP